MPYKSDYAQDLFLRPYHVFVYDISNETREYLIKLREFVPESYSELLYRMFHNYRENVGFGTNKMYADCYNIRDYILKHELDMLIYDNYTKPYKFIIDSDIYNDKYKIEEYRKEEEYSRRHVFRIIPYRGRYYY